MTERIVTRHLFTAILAFVLAASVSAQTAGSGRAARNEVRTASLKSGLLGREVNYRVVLPRDYKASKTKRYPVIYLLHGLFGHFDNWTEMTRLAEYAAAYGFLIVMPECGDGWYTDSASVAGDKYESYFVREFVPAIDAKYLTVADAKHRYVAGLSMGGYGAVKFGLKYPRMFGLVGSFSGALDSPIRGEENNTLRPSIMSVFGADDSAVRRENDVFRIIREMSADKLKIVPYIYLACGTEDFLFQANREFDTLLVEHKVPHEYRELTGTHAWDFWDEQLREFLRVADARLRRKN
jgi:putative tributyrin esterase